MKCKAVSLVLSVLAVVVLISGCSKSSEDARFAHAVLNGLYNGSLDAIQDRLGTEMQSQMAKELIAQDGPALRRQFGEVNDFNKDVNLKLNAPVEGIPNVTQQVWTVTAERGSFDLVMTLDDDGKLLGVFATPSDG